MGLYLGFGEGKEDYGADNGHATQKCVRTTVTLPRMEAQGNVATFDDTWTFGASGHFRVISERTYTRYIVELELDFLLRLQKPVWWVDQRHQGTITHSFTHSFTHMSSLERPIHCFRKLEGGKSDSEDKLILGVTMWRREVLTHEWFNSEWDTTPSWHLLGSKYFSTILKLSTRPNSCWTCYLHQGGCYFSVVCLSGCKQDCTKLTWLISMTRCCRVKTEPGK